MIHDLGTHPYFRPWVDPRTGVVSYVLTERVAPVQQSLYFASPSLSPDGRWLWFYCAFPPGRVRTIGVVSMDQKNPFIRHFPNAQLAGHFELSTMVAPANEEPALYLCMGPSVWRLGIGGDMVPICTLDDEYIGNRRLDRLSCRLTASADGRLFLLVGQISNHSFVAVGERETGQVRVLHEFQRAHAHASFSPHDPDLFLVTQEWYKDPITGRRFSFDIHAWLMDVGQTFFEPILVQGWAGHGSNPNHEFWSGDGWVCWVDYKLGAFEWHPDNRTRHHVWHRPLCHAHASTDRQLWCADQTPYTWDQEPCAVLFYRPKTRNETAIASALPRPDFDWRALHLHPHPQFVLNDRYIVYTTTVFGSADVAIAPVSALC